MPILGEICMSGRISFEFHFDAEPALETHGYAISALLSTRDHRVQKAGGPRYSPHGIDRLIEQL